MTKLALILLFSLSIINLNGQKTIYKTFKAGRPANDTDLINVPYVKLNLYKDGSYLLVPYSPDCWGLYTLEGKYRITGDSVILTIDEYYPEIKCKFIDTFHRKSWHTLHYYDKEKRKYNEYTFLLEKDTTETSVFPTKFLDTITPLKSKRFVTDTFYLPKKILDLKQMKFYKPKRKKAPNEYIIFKIFNSSTLIPEEKYKYLVRPFESLQLQ